jgi:hypothetical protein
MGCGSSRVAMARRNIGEVEDVLVMVTLVMVTLVMEALVMETNDVGKIR